MDKGAKFICDRSGKTGYMRDAVVETGTGFLVLKSEVDRHPYDAVNHPQANLHKYSPKYNDPKPIKNARPDISWHSPQVYSATGNSGGQCLAFARPDRVLNGTGTSNGAATSAATGYGSYATTGTSAGSGTGAATGSYGQPGSGSSTGAGTTTATGLGNYATTGTSTGAGTTSATGIVSPYIIENFEASPFTGLLDTWTETATNVSSYSTTRTTTSVNQGTYNWELAATATAAQAVYSITLGPFDFTGYSSVSVYADTDAMDANIQARFKIYDGAAAGPATISIGADTATTLSRSLTGGMDITDVYIELAIKEVQNLSTGSGIVRFDNLRVEV